MSKRHLTVFAVSLLTAGCQMASYPSADDKTPSATLVFQRDHKDSFGESALQTFSISENQQCTDTKDAAKLLWAAPETQTARLASGRRIVVLAKTNYFFSDREEYSGPAAGAENRNKVCGSAASFLLETGHAYQIRQVAPSYGHCRLTVLDSATNQAPASLKVNNDDGDVCSAGLRD